MTSTKDCVNEILSQTERTDKFKDLIKGNTTSWKRINKFKYKDGIRRYFYLEKSVLLATVDEVDGNLTVVIRPPALWEQYMIGDARPNDEFVEEDFLDLWDDHNELCVKESAKYMEPEQFSFTVGDEDGGWIQISPIKYDSFDDHLSGTIDDILPDYLRNEEVMECTYATPMKSVNSIKQDLINLGFVYY